MGKTLAELFFHPYEPPTTNPDQKKNQNTPFYYDQIPIFFNKIYRSIDLKLKVECKSRIQKEKCILNIIVLDNYLEDFKNYILSNPRYESVKFKINYKNLKLLDLIKSNKHFMYYMHIPNENVAFWFSEARFFTLEEIELTKDKPILEEITKFVEDKKINYLDFLEEWVGLIFHLGAEYLLFKHKIKVIFYSCEKCNRPALIIKKEMVQNENVDENKIWGTVNIVDTIIYNFTKNLNFSELIEKKKRSKNNIIYYDESYKNRAIDIKNDCKLFKGETDGAFILMTQEILWNNFIEELKEKEKDNNLIYKFDLIISGSTTEKILKKINNLKGEKYIDRVCIYTYSPEKYKHLKKIFNKIEDIFYYPNEIQNFIHLKNQNSEIFPIVNLLTKDDYSEKYSVIHREISSHYGQTNEDCFKVAQSFLKDYLLWYPKLRLKLGKEEEIKIEQLLKIVQKFKGINDNETNIITTYTKENNSFYQDFNYWLNNLDPLSIQKTSWFIASVMYNLNEYSQKKGKGVKESKEFYRGIKMNLCDILSYERSKGEIICFPSFTSTTPIRNIAKKFAEENKTKNQYEIIIKINYIYKDGFIPNAIDISSISAFKEEKEHLFLPFSFFKITKVDINHEKKKGEIELDSIGRKKIMEKYLSKENKLEYNINGFMDIVNL